MNPLEINACKFVFLDSFKEVKCELNSYFGCFLVRFAVFRDVADIEGDVILFTVVLKEWLRSGIVEFIRNLWLMDDLRLVRALLVLIAIDSTRLGFRLSQNDLIAFKRRHDLIDRFLFGQVVRFILRLWPWLLSL